MKEVQPESTSLILRATHILVVRIESTDDKPWVPAESVGEERMLHLKLAIEEVVKGVVKQEPGDIVEVDARQERIEFAWGPRKGIWSNSLIDPETRVVAFSSTTSDDAAVVLDDPAGIRLVPPFAALADVHLAARIEESRVDLAGALALAKQDAEKLTDLTAEYLWERYGRGAMADLRQFDLVASFMEEPTLGAAARTTLLMTLSTAVHAPEPPATKLVDRLAVAEFHLLAMPETKPQHDNLVSTYLPNLLNVSNPHTRPASKVFEDYPGEQAKALQAVSAYKGTQPAEPLRAWLSR